MTADERLSLVRNEIEGADQEFQKFEAARKAFWKTNPYEFRLKANPETGHGIYYMGRVESVPVDLRILAGNIFNKLRGSLDALSHQLVLTNGEISTADTGYPFCETASEYESVSVGKVQGMGQDAIEVIRETKPYRGGNKDLWFLYEASTVSKDHPPAMAIVWIEQTLVPKSNKSVFAMTDLGVPWFTPLKAGDILAPDVDPAVYKEVNTTFGIAFSQPEIRKLNTASKVLEKLIQFTDNFVCTFRPLLT